MGLQTSLDSDMSSMDCKSDSESESSCDTIVTNCNIKQTQIDVKCLEAFDSSEQLTLSASKLAQNAQYRESCRSQTITTDLAIEIELSEDDKKTIRAESCSRYSSDINNEIVPRDQCKKQQHSSPKRNRKQIEATSMQIKPANQADLAEPARGFTETQPKLVCVSRRLKEYFESLKSGRREKSQSLYQFFKSVRTELVASLLFALITSQALISLRSSNLFRVGDEVSKFQQLDSSHRVPTKLEPLVPSWDRAGVQMSFSLVLSLTVATLTQIFGHVSGCHLAPSISLALYVKGHISAVRLGSYVLAQSTGPLLGLTLLSLLTSSRFDEAEIKAISARRKPSNHSDMKRERRRRRRQVLQNFNDIQDLEIKINNSDPNWQQTSHRASRVNLIDVYNGSKSGQNLMMTRKNLSVSDKILQEDQSRISDYLSSINATHSQGIENLLISIENHADELRKARHKLASSTEAWQDRPINRTLPASNASNTTTRPSSNIASNQSAMIASVEFGQHESVPIVEAERAITVAPAALTIATTTVSKIAASQVVGEIEFSSSLKQPTGSEKVETTSRFETEADTKDALNFAINADAASQSITTEPRLKRPRKHSMLPDKGNIGSVYHAPRRLKAPGDSASELGDSKHDARSRELPTGEHPSSISGAFIAPKPSAPKLQIRRSTGSQSVVVVDASSNRSDQEAAIASNGLPGNEPDFESKSYNINLLELALPNSIMPTDTMSQCILAASAQTSNYKRDSETRLSPESKLSTGSESGNGSDEAASLFNMCLSRTNSSQMFVYQFVATLVIVLAYLVNVDPRRVDAGFRSLSIGLAYFVANILTIHSGGFFANPFQLVWLNFLSSKGQWRSEWFVYMICPLVAGLFGAMSHEYIDFTSTRNRNRTLHMRRSFFSLNELSTRSTANQIGTPNNLARCCSHSHSHSHSNSNSNSNSRSPSHQQQYHSMHQMDEIRAVNGKRCPSRAANTTRSISIDSPSSSVYSLVVMGDEQIARPSASTIGTSTVPSKRRASDTLRLKDLHSDARRSEFDSNFFISASPIGI